MFCRETETESFLEKSALPARELQRTGQMPQTPRVPPESLASPAPCGPVRPPIALLRTVFSHRRVQPALSSRTFYPLDVLIGPLFYFRCRHPGPSSWYLSFGCLLVPTSDSSLPCSQSRSFQNHISLSLPWPRLSVGAHCASDRLGTMRVTTTALHDLAFACISRLPPVC